MPRRRRPLLWYMRCFICIVRACMQTNRIKKTLQKKKSFCSAHATVGSKYIRHRSVVVLARFLGQCDRAHSGRRDPELCAVSYSEKMDRKHTLVQNRTTIRNVLCKNCIPTRVRTWLVAAYSSRSCSWHEDYTRSANYISYLWNEKYNKK